MQTEALDFHCDLLCNRERSLGNGEKFIMNEPNIAENVFIAEGAIVKHDVTIKEGANIWYNAVIRGDANRIEIGKNTNVQDNCVLHTSPGAELIIGEGVTIGHGAIVHGCRIGDNSLIGMGAIVLDHAVIGKNCIIGAGALVTGRTVIPDNSMVLGSPAKVRRELSEAEIEGNRANALHYVEEARILSR